MLGPSARQAQFARAAASDVVLRLCWAAVLAVLQTSLPTPSQFLIRTFPVLHLQLRRDMQAAWSLARSNKIVSWQCRAAFIFTKATRSSKLPFPSELSSCWASTH